jgi:hypothetical protein
MRAGLLWGRTALWGERQSAGVNIRENLQIMACDRCFGASLALSDLASSAAVRTTVSGAGVLV